MSFSKTISSELHNTPVLDAALPNATAVTSAPFLCSGSALGLEIVGTVTKAATIASGKKLTVKLLASETKNGTFSEYAVLCTATDKTLAAGTELFRFAPVSTVPFWKKISITADSDLSAGKIMIGLVRKVG